MNSIEFTFQLPEDLAVRARTAGVLTTDRLIGLIEKELERQFYAQQLMATMDRLQALEPRLTEEEIEREIQIYRAEKRAKRNQR